jgi:hypothetical protein
MSISAFSDKILLDSNGLQDSPLKGMGRFLIDTSRASESVVNGSLHKKWDIYGS